MRKDNTDEEAYRRRPLNRRAFMGSAAAACAFSVAGCSGLGGGGDGGADTPTPTPADGNGGDGGDGGVGDGARASGGIGQSVAGDYAAVTVEYVQPVDRVLSYDTVDSLDTPYGVAITVEDLIRQGFATPGSSLYGIGVVFTNVSDSLVDVSTTFLQNEAGIVFHTFRGRSQQLTIAGGRNNTAVNLLPGETIRGELVVALDVDPSEYDLQHVAVSPLNARTELLSVDLGSGSAGTAGYGQSPPVESLESPVTVGDFEVTMHSVSLVDSVEESPYQDLFGPREGYRYLLFDLTGTRTGQQTFAQVWSLGATSEDGHAFLWNHGIYDDVTDLNRPTLETLEVGETLEHVRIAMLVEEDWTPDYVTFEAPGRYPEESPFSGRLDERAVWPLA